MTESSEPTETAPEVSTEDRAKQLGWKDAEEFNGPADAHISAEAFIEKGENELPVLKQNLRKMQTDMAEMQSGIKSYKEMTSKTIAAQQTELEKSRQIAIEDGDVEKVKTIEAQKDALDIKEEIPTDINSAVAEFVERNPFSTSPSWSPRIEAIDIEISNTYPGLSPRDHMLKVENVMKERFATDLGLKNSKRDKISPVDTNGRRSMQTNKTELTGEQEAAFKRQQKMFKKAGVEFTKEQYTKELRA